MLLILFIILDAVKEGLSNQAFSVSISDLPNSVFQDLEAEMPKIRCSRVPTEEMNGLGLSFGTNVLYLMKIMSKYRQGKSLKIVLDILNCIEAFLMCSDTKKPGLCYILSILKLGASSIVTPNSFNAEILNFPHLLFVWYGEQFIKFSFQNMGCVRNNMIIQLYCIS